MIEGEEEEKGLFGALKCHCGEFPFIVYWLVLLEEGSGLSPFPCSLLLGWRWSHGFRLGLFGETTGTILETLYYRNVNMLISVNSSNSQILVACPILSWSFRFKQTFVCWVCLPGCSLSLTLLQPKLISSHLFEFASPVFLFSVGTCHSS